MRVRGLFFLVFFLVGASCLVQLAGLQFSGQEGLLVTVQMKIWAGPPATREGQRAFFLCFFFCGPVGLFCFVDLGLVLGGLGPPGAHQVFFLFVWK